MSELESLPSARSHVAAVPHSPRQPAWTPEAIGRFWDYWSGRRDKAGWYFSLQMGAVLVELMQSAGILQGEIIDYGCARGDLIQFLLAANAGRVSALEFSPESVDLVNRRYASQPGWAGARRATSLPVPFDSASFDLACCVEVVEHLIDDWYAPTFHELARLLKPGGHLFLSTPAAEELEQNLLYCAFCDSEFHSVQHVRSITPSELDSQLKAAGLEVLFCDGVDLLNFHRPEAFPPFDQVSLDVPKTFGRIKRSLGFRVLKLLDRIAPPSGLSRAFLRAARHRGPHLVAVARKPQR